ncbi:hypothetical protein K469DRAFT_742329 [Zopfia rhizophila CBS 207.26]|uniref:Uncharacterized protein n=1 Tax=Zopfia rhizophila CBS 207.26 TaxID=1314779 RepID=A0A6A6DEJ1_9PEZI|nr:hypothetical protein K469DRAFT_742329 [Zopfia rhizophila CBS 207.26]
MASRSAELLEVDEYENVPNLHRSRSGGYTDFLEEQDKWERRDRERQMKRYHDQRRSHQRQSSDLLYVPAFEPAGHRRVRSYGEINEISEKPTRSYNVREQKPSYDLSDEPARPSQLPVRRTWIQQRRPSITVEIHQDKTPSASATASPRRSPNPSPRKSPSASPRTPSAVPQLQFQFATLQNKLSEISTICAPNKHVEAVNPRDLTFSKIADEVGGHAFQLKAWDHIVNVNNMERIDKSKREVIELASRTLDRLFERASELSKACAKARPRDLKIEPVPEVDDGSDWDSNDEHDDESTKDVTESLGFVIQSQLDGITIQIQTLSRLTRSLQEATPDAGPEVLAVNNLVGEVDKFFGSAEALKEYAIDTKFAGKKALEEARYTARLK